MPTTYVDYTATAAQTDFAFSFDYLEDEHVVVEIDGVATTDFTLVTSPSTKIVLNSGATVGQKVRVRRKSQPDTNLVDFENGSVLTESELDRAYLHNRYLNEEIAELNDASLQKEVGSDSWDAKSQKMVNLTDPTEAQDAATKNYVDTQVSSEESSRIAADALKVDKAGDSMTGALAMGSNKITGLGTPTATTDATTKTYVDNKVNQAATGTSNPPNKYVFTGTAGANTTYTVTGAEINGDTAYDVSIDGAVQEPTTDFTVDPDTDTLTIIPTLSGGEDIVVIERGFGIPITTGTIGSSQIATGSITYDKIQNVSANNVLLGNDNGAGQDVQELTAAEARTLLDFDTEVANNTAVAANTAKVTNATHTGDVTGDTALTIASNAVTSAKISDTDTQFLVDDTSAQKTVVVNEGGADVDFRVEGDSDQNLLFCEGSSDKVLIGDSSADENAKFSVVGNGAAVVQSLENKSTTGLAALVIRAATAILQLKDDQASVDSGTFNVQSAGDKLEIELISDDGLTATTLLDIDTSGNMRIAGTLTENHTF